MGYEDFCGVRFQLGTFQLLILNIGPIMGKVSKKLFSVAKSPFGDLMVGTVFEKFSGLLPIKKIVETDKIIAFWHPKPFWEDHILIVPKKAIKGLIDVNDKDFEYIIEVYKVVRNLIKKLGWQKSGYTLLTNGGLRQEVNQLHFHLTRGKEI